MALVVQTLVKAWYLMYGVKATAARIFGHTLATMMKYYVHVTIREAGKYL